ADRLELHPARLPEAAAAVVPRSVVGHPGSRLPAVPVPDRGRVGPPHRDRPDERLAEPAELPAGPGERLRRRDLPRGARPRRRPGDRPEHQHQTDPRRVVTAASETGRGRRRDARRAIPPSVVLVLVGLAISLVGPNLSLPISPHLILVIVLPGLMFEAAFR